MIVGDLSLGLEGREHGTPERLGETDHRGHVVPGPVSHDDRGPPRPPEPGGGVGEGLGVGLTDQPGLTVADVPNLRLRWAFGIPGASQVRTKPTVVGDVILFGDQFGNIYAIESGSGCVRWTFEADSGLRSSILLGEDADGILALDENAQVGTDLRGHLGLDDWIIDLDLTPNRGDCFGLAGVAREIAVVNRLPLAAPEIEPVAAVIDDAFPIELSAPAACPAYTGRIVRNIRSDARSPVWMQERLRRSGPGDRRASPRNAGWPPGAA